MINKYINLIVHFFKYSVAIDYNGYYCIIAGVLIAFFVFLYLLFCRKLSLVKCSIISIIMIYMGVLFAATIVSRQSMDNRTIILTPFWSLQELSNGKKGYLTEILVNIMMFVPLGILIQILNKKITHTVLICLLISAGIECLQFFFQKGICELDDCVYNICGALVGALIGVFVDRVYGRWHEAI